MNKIIILLLTLLLTASCEKPNDRMLRGRWKMTQKVTPQASVNKDSTFYSFANHVFCFQQISKESYGATEAYGEFFLTGEDSLFIEMKDDRYASEWMLSLMEWHSRSKRFKIERLNTRELILSEQDTVLFFKIH